MALLELNKQATVIIPCFNVETYIQECLDSVLLQGDCVRTTFVVDNNSTDNTVKKIRNWQKSHPSFPLVLLEEKKPGAPAARNRPLGLVETKWIQFLDADDLLLKNKIVDQIAASPQADVICGGASHQALDGTVKNVFPEPDIPLALMKSTAGNTCSNLFSTSHIHLVNGWNESLKSSQEYDLMFRLWQAGAAFATDLHLRACIRERPSGQISQSEPSKKWKQLIELQLQILQHALSIGINSDAHDKMLQALFDRIRTLAKYDLTKANEYFKIIPGSNEFVPNVNALNSQAYVRAFRAVGFYRAEKIKRWFNLLSE